MNPRLRLVLLLTSLVFLYAVIRLVARGRLQLKYSLLWLLLGVVILICVIFPGLATAVSQFVGIATPANLVFLMGIGLLMLICVSLTIIVSWQAHDIRSLIQRVALLEKQLYEKEGKHGLPCE